MWSGIATIILKAVPWGAVFSGIMKAILTNEKAKKAFYDFIYNLDDRVPPKNLDEYERQKKELREKLNGQI